MCGFAMFSIRVIVLSGVRAGCVGAALFAKSLCPIVLVVVTL